MSAAGPFSSGGVTFFTLPTPSRMTFTVTGWPSSTCVCETSTDSAQLPTCALGMSWGPPGGSGFTFTLSALDTRCTRCPAKRKPVVMSASAGVMDSVPDFTGKMARRRSR
ncbi:hypothetical protein LILAB_30435 [Corallococcus macrosporus]|uniref:Uncharacterized protein n=1 Tax=Myxococcus fulvus (strain ATCC BAA-855 / HW-1) TaxID=483219 RepID=F8CQQ4_MYXFH|nr:hypothetical protein LILAB_30435 [Corallococcus macrosporus]